MPLATKEILPITRAPAVPTPPNPAMHWLDLYGDMMFAYAVRRVRRYEVAEDLVQETLLAGVQSWNNFAHQANVSSWLTGILRHKISDHLRARYRNEKIEGSSLDDDQMFNKNGTWKQRVSKWKGDPHQLAESGELKAVINSCMSKLPTRMAHLFLSRATDEVSTADLCSELEITSENAWALLHRARLRLRQCLTNQWFCNDAAAPKTKGD